MFKQDNRTRLLWEIFILLITIFMLITIPFSVVFISGIKNAYLPLELFFTIVFLIDILFHFNTAVTVKRILVADKSRVASYYFYGWFWIDILSALPFYLLSGYLFPQAGPAVLIYFRLIRLLKVFRAFQTLKKTKSSSHFNPNMIRMALLVFWILITAHFVACGWVFLEGKNTGMDNATQYIRALYWTITTLTTIGYGDITPVERVQIIYTMFVQIIGAGLYGFIIGNIASLIANIDIARAQHREKIEKINTFMQYRNIPSNLQKRVNDYYSYLWETRRGYDESSVLQDLPVSLKTNVSIFLNRDMIEKVPIFKGADDAMLKDIILNLEPIVFTPGDYVVKKGEIGFDMYFISRGSVDVVSEDENIVYATLTSGQFFGEIALLLSASRTATIKTREYCDLYRLNKETFDRVLERYPEFAVKIKEMAESRRREVESPKK